MNCIDAEIRFSEEGRKVLFYVEPEGDDATLHMITEIQGVGQADIKAYGSAELVEKHWAAMLEDNFEEGVRKVVEAVEAMEAELAGGVS